MAWPFGSISTSLVDSNAGEGDGFEEGCGDDSFPSSGSVDFECVDVVCFTLFDGVASILCKLPSAFLFLIGDILILSLLTMLIQKLRMHVHHQKHFSASTIDKGR